MNVIANTLRDRGRFAALAGFVLLCVIIGGSSRPDNLSHLFVRPLSICFIVFVLAVPGARDWTGLRRPMLLLGAFAASMAIQLVPLPPALWIMLPGHERFVGVAALAGTAQPWRPISVAPDMTLNSLLALVVPLATLVGATLLAPWQRAALIPILLVATVASAVLGILQWAGSGSSPLYFYRYTNRDLPVGFFANRNHQAVFLAMALPLLRVWTLMPRGVVSNARTRAGIAGAAALLIFPVILATGSRTGLVMAVLGSVAVLLLAPLDLRVRSGRLPSASPHGRLVTVVGAAVAVSALAATFFFGRALSVTRLGQLGEVEADLRVRYLPIIADITRDFLPWGSGFGTFDPMFRIYEPFWALKRTYFNHAHNDLLELAMTGGIPALFVVVAFMVLVLARFGEIRAWGRARSSSAIAGAGMIVVLIGLSASLTDYPLRTPAMAMVLALATSWMTIPLEELRRPSSTARGRGERTPAVVA